MKQLAFLGLAASLACAALAGCANAGAGSDTTAADAPVESIELHISAATTLKRGIEELIPAFEAAHPGVTVVGNYAASGVLQLQIEEGAPCDVFVSADPKPVAALIERGLVSAEASRTLCSNDVAIVVPADDSLGIKGPDDLERAKRLSIGNPETAPTGAKAKEWLMNLGVWETLEPKFVFGENIAQALDYVARNEVDAGLMFASEATGADDVKIVYLAPARELSGPVRYVIAPATSAEQAELADEFVAFMLEQQAQDVLARWGLRPVAEMD